MEMEEKKTTSTAKTATTDKPKKATRATKATTKKKDEGTNKDNKKRTPRKLRTGLSERTLIREKLRDWTADEVRSAQSRINEKTKVLNFKMDPRNAELLNQFTNSNGLGKALTVDLAVFRFVSDIEDRGADFPYQALSQVDIKDDENVSFKISSATKERLDNFCKTNRQQSQLVVNIALECFFNEVRNVM